MRKSTQIRRAFLPNRRLECEGITSRGLEYAGFFAGKELSIYHISARPNDR